MKKTLCIHGHFYQPPREDPWLREVLPEGSAAPRLHWNERISRESYGPLAWARRMDGEGRITDIVNTYAWISFNFGPTLLSWMERGDPDTYARVLAGDRQSVQRWGHGNAMAQVYHHLIMPLASPLDKQVETVWGLADFEARFGRKAEGMWLAEAAVDTASLEVLARYGVRFVVLAPRQAKAVASLDNDGEWILVDESSLDVTRAYSVELPSGRSIAAFFYHGALSQAVAFERLLEDGEAFWRRISGFFCSRCNATSALLPLATDGETYGHHFKFGEMALAYVLAQTFEGRDQIALSNFGTWLAGRPPTMKAVLHEPSSWSCVHGVERWRSDCGCTTGGHPGFNQKWRKPLREALDGLKAELDAHFFKRGGVLFNDAQAALLEYGAVLAGSKEQEAFAAAHCKPGLLAAERQAAWRLLGMQQWALASFASCAWFFDEISRIEPMNGLTYALRAMELSQATGGPGVEALEAALTAVLEGARSNFPDLGSGKDLYESFVRPRREHPASLAAQALLSLEFQGRALGDAPEEVAWPGVRVSLRKEKTLTSGNGGGASADVLEGGLSLAWTLEHEEDVYLWRWEKNGPDPLQGRFFVSPVEGSPKDAPGFSPLDLPWNKLQSLALIMAENVASLRGAGREERLRTAAGYVFLPYQESQDTQNQEPLWRALWPAMAWRYALGEGLPENDEHDGVRSGGVRSLEVFLKRTGAGHPDRMLVGESVVRHVLDLLAASPPQWECALDIVSRANAIELRPDWWPVQNRLWEMEVPALGDKPGKELADAMGFRM